MAKEKFKRNKPHCNLDLFSLGGDKSSLLNAIVRIMNVSNFGAGDTHFEFETDNRHYSLAENLGLPEYIKNVVMGKSRADGVILLLSANNVRISQLREFALIAKQIDLSKVIVFLDGCDKVSDQEILELLDADIRDAFSRVGLDGDKLPIVHGSASGALKGEKKWVDKINELLKFCDEYIPIPLTDADKPFLMAIEETFTITGRGTVVTGHIEHGKIHIGDKVECVGFGKRMEYIVTGVEMFRKTLDEAQAGDNVGLLLRGAEKKDILRGMVLVAPNSIKECSEIDIQLYVLTKDEGGRHSPFMNGYRPQLYIRTTDVTGTVSLPAGVQLVTPGETITVHVKLVSPMLLEVGLQVRVREGGRTIAYGVITKLYY